VRYERIITTRDVVGWRAYPDAGDGPDTLQGWGASEIEAIEDLLERMEAEGD
jgi:hypothetical protein